MRARSVVLALAAAAALGACSNSPSTAWNGPGWYLELPYTVVAGGPGVYGGPMTYDACEAKRAQEIRPERFLCVNETKQQPKFGIY